jgi:hypothetical protein
VTLFVAQTHGLEHVIYKVVQLRVVDHRLFETLFGVVRAVNGADQLLQTGLLQCLDELRLLTCYDCC